jgi:hypothetical protein
MKLLRSVEKPASLTPRLVDISPNYADNEVQRPRIDADDDDDNDDNEREQGVWRH